MKRLTRGQILNGRGAQPIRNAMQVLRAIEATQRAQADGQDAAPVPASAVVLGHHAPATGTRVLLQDGSIVQVRKPNS